MSKFDPAIIAAAQASQHDLGVPASVSLAQFALESAYGTKMPAGSNNPFGIKAVGNQPFVTASTREVVNGQSIQVQARFRKFANFAEAFAAHASLLATVSLYAPAIAAWKAGDLKGGVELMAKHYATDPNYAALIISIIRDQNLAQYDAAPASAPTAAAAPPGAAAPQSSEIMRAWQQLLIDTAAKEGHPNPLPKYGADGYGGAETRTAILAFQASRNPPLPQTGQFDDATRAALNPPRPPVTLNPIETALIETAIDAIIPPSPAKEFLMFNFGNIVHLALAVLPGLPDSIAKIGAAVQAMAADTKNPNATAAELRDAARFARILADEADLVADTLDPSGSAQPTNTIAPK